MARDKALRVWVDGITAARVSLRAEEAGTTLSEYIGELLIKDATEGGRADALAGELLEMQYLNAILLRTLLGKGVGEAEADKLLNKARAKAHEQAQNTLSEIRSARRKTG